VPGIDGQTERPNGAFWKSDIEGKTARVAASELGKERVSNERQQMSQHFGVSAVEASSRLGNRFVTILVFGSLTCVQQ